MRRFLQTTASVNHSILTPGQPALAPTASGQASGRVTIRKGMLTSLVWHGRVPNPAVSRACIGLLNHLVIQGFFVVVVGFFVVVFLSPPQSESAPRSVLFSAARRLFLEQSGAGDSHTLSRSDRAAVHFQCWPKTVSQRSDRPIWASLCFSAAFPNLSSKLYQFGSG